jgi:hypothetical protein
MNEFYSFHNNAMDEPAYHMESVCNEGLSCIIQKYNFLDNRKTVTQFPTIRIGLQV